LLENEDGTKTELARRTAASFDAIYVDEYQDINPIQHRIIESISRPDNRFMVGDVKQSIYGFRRAEPSLFSYMKETFPPLNQAKESCTAAVHLSENFRSNIPVLGFINRIFDVLFGHTGKSIAYSESDRLVCGNKKECKEKPCVTFVLPVQTAAQSEDESDERTPARMAEAAYVAEQIKAILKETNENGEPRYKAGDIAVLLRTRTHADIYADAMREKGVATSCADGREFFLQKEILLCLCLLNTIDNPLRDIYLSGLMMSPIFAFSADELMRYKAALQKDYPLWHSIREYAKSHEDEEKLHRFIKQIESWRALAETIPCDRLLRRLFKETGLLALAGKDSAAGRTNLLLLYEHSRRFENGTYGGLHGFIDYINQMIEAKKSFERPKSSGSEDAVQIISVHSSKGLEFPVCFLCECGAPLLSKKDGASHFLMHSQNLCALEMRDETGFARVKNPLYEITKSAFLKSRAEEEIRVLYVALTRAKERLYVTASPSGNTKPETTIAAAERLHRAPSEYAILKSKSFFILLAGALGTENQEVQICGFESQSEEIKQLKAAAPEKDEALVRELKRRFAFSYPLAHLRALPAKLSVSRLTPTVLDGADEAAKILEIKGEEAEAEANTFAVPHFIADTAPSS
ncbi:MAG: UvrD-helicase domain-containing protein, partial [Clostridia bacterium]|nr:UvrD-helicase domain-containing protein [Clostridia bacterium]